MNISTRGSLNGEPEALTFSVGGMDCGSCAAKIETALSRLPGVADVKVSVARERLNLSLAENKTPVEKIEDTLRKLGFKPALLPQEKAAREKTPDQKHEHDHDHATCGGHHDHDHSGHDHSGHDHSGHDHAGHDHASKDAKTAAAAKDHGHGLPGHVHEATPEGASWYQTAKGRLVIATGLFLGAAYAAGLIWPGIGHWAFILACIVGVLPVAKRAFAAARAGIPFTIEMLMTIAAIGALFIGAAEEAALVVFLFAVGEVLEGVAADRARASIRALGASEGPALCTLRV